MMGVKVKETKGDRVFLVIVHILIALVTLIILYPLIVVLSSSVSRPELVATGQVWLLPKGFNIMGYQRVFQDPMIMTGYGNTIFYTVVGTAINIAVTIPAGYALAKKDLPARRILIFVFIFIMYFSGGMIPEFLLIQSLGLYDTRTLLLILGAFGAYNCIICRAFFESVPQELEEAAFIDGCSPIRAFFQVILPISQALIGVMVLFFAVSRWNAYFGAMIYTRNPDIVPLQLVLRRILILEDTSRDMLTDAHLEDIASRVYLIELIKYAVIVVSSLPLLVLYPFLQKYFVKGVLIGSVKG